jgi:hypothetical protein
MQDIFSEQKSTDIKNRKDIHAPIGLRAQHSTV